MAASMKNPGAPPPGPDRQPVVMDKPVTPPRAPQHDVPTGIAAGSFSGTDPRPPSSRKG